MNICFISYPVIFLLSHFAPSGFKPNFSCFVVSLSQFSLKLLVNSDPSQYTIIQNTSCASACQQMLIVVYNKHTTS